MIRSVLLYALIVAAVRLMGKKQLAQLQPSELVTTILISNIATLALEDPGTPMIYGIIPIMMIVSLDVFMSFIMLKSERIRRLVAGTPQVIISEGRIEMKTMKNLRYSIDELTEAMHENMIFDITQIQYAIVETTGKINFMLKSGFQPAEKADVNANEQDSDPPAVVIKDGIINRQELDRAGISEKELIEMVKKGGCNIKSVFYMAYDGENAPVIIPKEDI